MSATVSDNTVTVDYTGQPLFSRARNASSRAVQAIKFEFFEIDNRGTPAPIHVEGCTSTRELEKMHLLLSIDFKAYAPHEFKSSQVNHVAREMQLRFDKDTSLQKFKTEWPDSPLGDLFVFFGGGVDSRAVSGLYPKARRVVIDTTLYSTYSLREGDVFIKSNLKSGAFSPRGFVFWSQPFAVAPILAAYYESTRPRFMIGSILGSSYLMNGRRYFDRESRSNTTFGITGNMYHSLFNELELPLYAPLANCSEYVSTKVELLTCRESRDLPAFCQNNGGAPCLKCFKCLRKITERYVVCKALDLDAPYADLNTLRAVAQSVPARSINFDYFYHIWNFASLRDPDASSILCGRGFNPSEDQALDLDVVYAGLERFYQDPTYSSDKLRRLSNLEIHPASSFSEARLKCYNPPKT